MAKKSIVTLFNILRVSQVLPSFNHSQFLTDRNFAYYLKGFASRNNIV